MRRLAWVLVVVALLGCGFAKASVRPTETPRSAPAIITGAQATATVAPAATSSTTAPLMCNERNVLLPLLSGKTAGVEYRNLICKPNPKGVGMFVYVNPAKLTTSTSSYVWLVLNGNAYPINDTSKDTTPSLPWPREAAEAEWKTTGLNPNSAAESLEIVFGAAK